MTATPVNITLHRKSRTLEIEWHDQVTHLIPCELLRVCSPSAEVRGHTPEQAVLVTGKRFVGIERLEPVGSYALRLMFDDGHDTGLYTWGLLRDLGEHREAHWKDYLVRLKSAGGSREPRVDAPRTARNLGGSGNAEAVSEWTPVTIREPVS